MQIHCTVTAVECRIASMFDRGFLLTMQAIRRQLAAMPHDLYLIRLIHQATKRPFPGERLWTASQLMSPATIRFLRGRDREGCDVYIHRRLSSPASAGAVDPIASSESSGCFPAGATSSARRGLRLPPTAPRHTDWPADAAPWRRGIRPPDGACRSASSLPA